MSFPQYSDYKKSDIHWLGDIPASWDKRRLKLAVFNRNEKVDAKSVDLSYVGLEHIQSKTGNLLHGDVEFEAEGTANRFYKSDILFGKLRPYLAKVLQCDSDGICTSELLVLKSIDVQPAFLKYFLLSDEFIKIVDSSTYGSKMPRASWDFIGNMSITIPTINEQTAIANFLDHETAKIDTLIAKQQRLIALLQEKRQALISHAVTQGLNPDAPMKDSGIEWLGEIPKHWETKRLHYIQDINPTKSQVMSLPDETLVSFIPMEDVGVLGGLTCQQEKQISDVKQGYTYFADGDVVVAKITPCFENGKGAVAANLTNGIAFGTTELHVLRPLSNCIGKFIFYVSISNHFRQLGKAEMYGAGGQKRVPEEFIRNLHHPVPSLKEQKDIADYLDLETAKTDLLINKQIYMVQLLQERRSSLISAAVTGKIDVRGYNTTPESSYEPET